MIEIYQNNLQFNSKFSELIFSVLTNSNAEYTSRFIGGCVRDALLNKPIYDFDIATILVPDEVIFLLKRSNIKVVPTGIKFGTVSAFIEDEKFEITTLRKELSYQGRFPTVVFTDDFQLDAVRRDFSINALSYCPYRQKIYDYFGGIEDLAKQKVVFIGNPYHRIKEDALRILRFFRFTCYYGGNTSQIDAEGLEACAFLKENLNHLSKERIIAEMNKLIVHPNSSSVLLAMFKVNILAQVLPISSFNRQAIKNYFIYATKLGYKIEYTTLYALLFYSNKNLQIADLLNLKFSKKEAFLIFKFIIFLQNNNKIDQSILKYLWLEKEFLQYLALLLSLDILDFASIKQFLIEYKDMKIPIFPIGGNDLSYLAVGPKIGEQLANLRKIWIDSNFSLSKAELLAKINP